MEKLRNTELEVAISMLELGRKMEVNTFQFLQRWVAEWTKKHLGEARLLDKKQRALRVLEEAIELAQASGIEQNIAESWVKHVYAKPCGEIEQEVAGVSVCLLGYGAAYGIDVGSVTAREMFRLERPEVIEKVRAKQLEKDKVGNA